MIEIRKIKQYLSNLILSLLVIATIPLAIYSIINTNFDPRKQAYEDIKITNNCNIILPYVNPKTLDKNKIYEIVIQGKFEEEKIHKIEIFNHFTETYSTPVNEILEKFILEPTKVGEIPLHGEIQTDKNTYPCKIRDNFLLVGENNTPPTILTDPYTNPKSNSIGKGQQYRYLFEARDAEGDTIHYHYTVSPKADWLHTEIISNGEYGQLDIVFQGIPDSKGSHKIELYIHDGYHKHISTQTWIIDVEQEEISDKPEKIQITEYTEIIDNLIQLNTPNITNLRPHINHKTQQPIQSISAMINASHGSKIIENSIIFELNNNNLTETINLIKISPSQILIHYRPNLHLRQGEHIVKIAFKDENNIEAETTWNFTITETEYESTLFGLPMSTIIIIAFGMLLILISISIPWVLYIAWKKNTDDI